MSGLGKASFPLFCQVAYRRRAVWDGPLIRALFLPLSLAYRFWLTNIYLRVASVLTLHSSALSTLLVTHSLARYRALALLALQPC